MPEARQARLPHLGIERHPHIPFEREPELEPQRRRRRAHPPQLPQRVPATHGAAIKREIADAVSDVARQREPLGITPDRLIVIEVQSWDASVRDVLEQRFGASVVDEKSVQKYDVELTSVLVQFLSRDDLVQFEGEAERYRGDDSSSSVLPLGMRTKFFDGLDHVRGVSREDRIGNRLRDSELPSQSQFVIDVDLWHPGTANGAREILENIRSICRDLGGTVTDDLRTTSLVLARISADRALAETLLELDIVAQVNLPPQLPVAYAELFQSVNPLPIGATPEGNEPTVGVVDSGIVAGHNLLRGWILDELDLSEEGTIVDQHGHGTQVAGLAVYGDVAKCIETDTWEPQCLVASAKVLRRDPFDATKTVFPDHRRPEALVDEAIRHLHRERGCRVFNLSLGNRDDIYRGGRQFAWAEILDGLARELDVVIVVAVGNNPNPTIPSAGSTREAFQAAVRDAMLSNSLGRVTNPSTATIAVSVGSIARSEAQRTPNSLAGAPAGAPAPFSRVGPGYESKPSRRSVKPDFVAYGGNIAVQNLGGLSPRWIDRDLHLGEPTTRLNADGMRDLTAVSGTSFSTPQVSNTAARALQAIGASQGAATANAARALMGVASETPPCGDDWLPSWDTNGGWDRLRLVGFGMINADRVRDSLDNDLCLIASDNVEDDHWHLFEIRVPPAFLAGHGERGVTVALAYDPPVRSSRRDYLARTMWVEVLKGLTVEEVIQYRAPHKGPAKPQALGSSKFLDLKPARTALQWSTLQVRRKRWSRAPRLPICNGSDDPILHVLVGSQSRFAHGQEALQSYSVAIRFWHTDEFLNLYQEFRARIRTRALIVPPATV